MRHANFGYLSDTRVIDQTNGELGYRSEDQTWDS